MISFAFVWTFTLALPHPQTAPNQQPISVQPVPGQLMPGAMIPTSVLNQIGDTTTQILPQTNANAMTAIRNFFGDVALVSNAISMIGSGAVTDPQTIANMAQVAFNAEINENDQRMVMLAASGGQSAAQDANNNILTFTPTVLNGLQALAQNPTQNAQLIAQTMGTVRNARILPSISVLATIAAGGSIPVSTVIQRTTQASNADQGAVQNFNSAALLAAVNNADIGQQQVVGQQTAPSPIGQQNIPVQANTNINNDATSTAGQSINDQRQINGQGPIQNPDVTTITILTGDQNQG